MTHSPSDVETAVSLAGTGLPASAIAARTGIPRGTVRDWLAGRIPASAGRYEVEPQALPPAYVYLLGLYLGDGCISAHPRGVYKLRLALDSAYPGIIASAGDAMRAVMPANRVGRSVRTGYDEVYCYSKAWPALFPQHGPGKKHERKIELASWQRELVELRPQDFLKGLIHSDGCRFMNTGRDWSYPRYSFSQTSNDIRGMFCDACDLLDVHWTWAPPNTIYVSCKADVAALDRFIGPKA